MWKRILVLVLFLFGVFWWLTNREQVSVETVNTEVTQEIQTEKVDTEESDSSDIEVETSDNTEETAKAVEVKIEAPKPVVNVPAVAPAVVKPVVVQKPASVVPKVEPLPAVVTDVKVYLYEWGLDMSQKTLPAGTVNFTVQNDGRFTHDFTIRGVKDFGKVTPGTTANFTTGLRAGEYEVFSGRREDYDRGLVDQIVVE